MSFTSTAEPRVTKENVDLTREIPEVAHPETAHIEQLLEQLQVDDEQGLSASEAEARQKQVGLNRLREAQQRGPWQIFFDQFKSVVLLMLLAAAVLALVVGEFPEAIAVLAVVVINGGIGFFTEWRAVHSMAALRKMGRRRTRIRRDGKDQEIAVSQLVPGDIVLQESGDVVPADVRLIEANNLRVDEAVLTGESVPVVKRAEPVDEGIPLAERNCMLYRGTTITEGSAKAVVVATGMGTELGHIAELAEEAEVEDTPLQRRLDQLGSRLAWAVLAVASLIAVIGLALGKSPLLMIETSIALGIAAVPEGLPIVATIALARGMWLMAHRNALINRLTAVQTLGATQVIFADKTGTLTKNDMTLRSVATPAGDHELELNDLAYKETAPPNIDQDRLLHRAVEIGVLCSNASITDADGDGVAEDAQGDPTEVALLSAGLALGINRAALLDERPESREVAFNPDEMMMATFHDRGEEAEGTSQGRYEVAVKGAPQAVLRTCTTIATGENDQETFSEDLRKDWFDRGEQLANEGLRVLAVADKFVDDLNVEPYESLRFVGIVGLYDPPAESVKQSVESCQSAGVKVVMVTGDQPATARAISREVGVATGDVSVFHGTDMPETDTLSQEDRARVLQSPVFARFSPEQKLRLIEIYQASGHTVAMTGDGVNDAPALKKADIGVAMGRRGTDAARQAADMVLQDDALNSVVAAIEQGRVIFGNIRKSVMFMLCTNVAEIIAVAVATVIGLPLPLRPLQILFLNVLTDVLPALALGVGRGDPHVMERPPRNSKESLLTRRHWLAIGGWSGVVATCVLVALSFAAFGLGLDTTTAVTVSFLTLGFSKLWFVINLRDAESRIWDNDIVRNGWLWVATAVCIVLLLMALYLPGLSTLLKTSPPNFWGWALVFSLSFVPTVAGQTILWLQRRGEWQSIFRPNENH